MKKLLILLMLACITSALAQTDTTVAIDFTDPKLDYNTIDYATLNYNTIPYDKLTDENFGLLISNANFNLGMIPPEQYPKMTSTQFDLVMKAASEKGFLDDSSAAAMINALEGRVKLPSGALSVGYNAATVVKEGGNYIIGGAGTERLVLANLANVAGITVDRDGKIIVKPKTGDAVTFSNIDGDISINANKNFVLAGKTSAGETSTTELAGAITSFSQEKGGMRINGVLVEGNPTKVQLASVGLGKSFKMILNNGEFSVDYSFVSRKDLTSRRYGALGIRQNNGEIKDLVLEGAGVSYKELGLKSVSFVKSADGSTSISARGTYFTLNDKSGISFDVPSAANANPSTFSLEKNGAGKVTSFDIGEGSGVVTVSNLLSIDGGSSYYIKGKDVKGTFNPDGKLSGVSFKFGEMKLNDKSGKLVHDINNVNNLNRDAYCEIGLKKTAPLTKGKGVALDSSDGFIVSSKGEVEVDNMLYAEQEVASKFGGGVQGDGATGVAMPDGKEGIFLQKDGTKQLNDVTPCGGVITGEAVGDSCPIRKTSNKNIIRLHEKDMNTFDAALSESKVTKVSTIGDYVSFDLTGKGDVQILSSVGDPEDFPITYPDNGKEGQKEYSIQKYVSKETGDTVWILKSGEQYFKVGTNSEEYYSVLDRLYALQRSGRDAITASIPQAQTASAMPGGGTIEPVLGGIVSKVGQRESEVTPEIRANVEYVGGLTGVEDTFSNGVLTWNGIQLSVSQDDVMKAAADKGLSFDKLTDEEKTDLAKEVYSKGHFR